MIKKYDLSFLYTHFGETVSRALLYIAKFAGAETPQVAGN